MLQVQVKNDRALNISSHLGSSFVNRALDLANRKMFNVSFGMRTNVKKIMILIMDLNDRATDERKDLKMQTIRDASASAEIIKKKGNTFEYTDKLFIFKCGFGQNFLGIFLTSLDRRSQWSSLSATLHLGLLYAIMFHLILVCFL